MASKKELLQAQSWTRRRLLSVFTSGRPGGREVEPTSPTRGLAAGLVIGALVLGGSYAVGLFDRGLPSGWEDGRIVLVRDNAARYVTVDGELVPVPNMATARLLAPSGAPIITVAADDVADVPRRSAVGIVGAPDALPPAAGLLTDGWLACVADDGATATSLGLAASATDGSAAATSAAGSATPPTSALVSVATGPDGVRTTYLVQDGRRYEVPLDVGLDVGLGVLRALDYTPEDAVPTGASWVALFEPGEDVTPFEVPGAGEIPPGVLASVAGVHVGDVLDVGARSFLVLTDGGLAELDPFADAIYATAGGGSRARLDVTPAQLATVAEVTPEESPVPQSWPTEIAAPLDAESTPCARLDAAGFGSTLEPGAHVASGGVRVGPGVGAVARFVAGPDSVSGPVRLIDESGVAFPVLDSAAGDTAEALARLFGEPLAPTPVPYAWGDLFPSGPDLSIDAAGLPASLAAPATTPASGS